MQPCTRCSCTSSGSHVRVSHSFHLSSSQLLVSPSMTPLVVPYIIPRLDNSTPCLASSTQRAQERRCICLDIPGTFPHVPTSEFLPTPKMEQHPPVGAPPPAQENCLHMHHPPPILPHEQQDLPIIRVGVPAIIRSGCRFFAVAYRSKSYHDL